MSQKNLQGHVYRQQSLKISAALLCGVLNEQEFPSSKIYGDVIEEEKGPEVMIRLFMGSFIGTKVTLPSRATK